jgi:hypothetical protein
MIPGSAFVTFEREEGVERLLTLRNKDSEVRILGKKPKIQKAPEPTDILWENRELSKLSHVMRLVLVALSIFLIMLISFVVLVALRKKTNETDEKYIEQDCSEIFDMYGDDLTQDYAVDEWFSYYDPQKNHKKKDRVSAVLSCFCKGKMSEVGLNYGFDFYEDSVEHKKA